MNSKGTYAFIVTIIIAGVAADVVQDLMVETVGLIDECKDREITICIKERALKYVDKLPSTVNIGGGLVVAQNDEVKRSARYMAPESIPEEPRAREAALDNIILNRIADYFEGHTFQFKIPQSAVQAFRRSFSDSPHEDEDDNELEEARKKKKQGGGKGILMLLQLKLAVVGAIMLKIIGVVAFKALILAKAALFLAGLLALKKHKEHSTSYEVIQHPYEDHHQHYDRSLTEPYRGYVNNKNNL